MSATTTARDGTEPTITMTRDGTEPATTMARDRTEKYQCGHSQDSDTPLLGTQRHSRQGSRRNDWDAEFEHDHEHAEPDSDYDPAQWPTSDLVTSPIGQRTPQHEEEDRTVEALTAGLPSSTTTMHNASWSMNAQLGSAILSQYISSSASGGGESPETERFSWAAHLQQASTPALSQRGADEPAIPSTPLQQASTPALSQQGAGEPIIPSTSLQQASASAPSTHGADEPKELPTICFSPALALYLSLMAFPNERIAAVYREIYGTENYDEFEPATEEELAATRKRRRQLTFATSPQRTKRVSSPVQTEDKPIAQHMAAVDPQDGNTAVRSQGARFTGFSKVRVVLLPEFLDFVNSHKDPNAALLKEEDISTWERFEDLCPEYHAGTLTPGTKPRQTGNNLNVLHKTAEIVANRYNLQAAFTLHMSAPEGFSPAQCKTCAKALLAESMIAELSDHQHSTSANPCIGTGEDALSQG
ncbi:hypothetical protein OPT61_g497 [Boeremia exigua]|uniref:Uncharacterized protein n=1 Tax=Boeremia exigua TaxID=749465 RepID=A0ACC2ITN4_9PLEO|nr:hypothetical protein OPT61_g497 [Boeremia exigua]